MSCCGTAWQQAEPAVDSAPWAAQLGFTLAARAETLPDVLRRVAPKIVRVQYDEDSIGTGFVYPDERHITTAYSVVNRKGDPEVVRGREDRHRARLGFADRPMLLIQDLESFFIVSASWMPTCCAARLDLGIVFNRFDCRRARCCNAAHYVFASVVQVQT